MKVNEMQNLYIGYNSMMDFKILICAWDEDEAAEIARTYKIDSNMDGEFEISEFNDINEKFDIDYIITGHDRT